MATEVISGSENIQRRKASGGLFSGRFGQILKENITAYLFLAPSLLIVFTFGIFPLLFAAYVSLYKWRIKQSDFRGLENYFTAMGDVAYVFFFIVALALIGFGVYTVYNAITESRDYGMPLHYPALALIPGFVIVGGLLSVILRFITFFAQEQSIESGDARIMGNIPLGVLAVVIGTIATIFLNRTVERNVERKKLAIPPNLGVPAITAIATLGAGFGIAYYAWNSLAVLESYATTIGNVRNLFFSLVALGIGYAIWTWASSQQSNVRMIGGLAGAAMFIGVGVYIVTIWPQVSANGSKDFYLSLVVTIFYSFFTVPFQLGISMILAYLLFQNIQGKGLFRIVFFIPYIAPTVATAGIFQALFSRRESGMANSFMHALGVPNDVGLAWLAESATAVSAFAEAYGVPGAADWDFTGPSLALFVIILYNIWVYVGYDTVIFLAGLGNIPNTLYEAAKIDGAGRWDIFRNITFPLLSPTTYFLSVVSIIGTFRAFNHVWVLRTPQAQGTADTSSIYFFETFLRQSRFGYATSMAMVLFVIILVLYIVQNRIAAKRVFYG